MEEFFSQALKFIYAALISSVPLLYGTLGEILIEKSGNLNLGVEGMMYIGAISGFVAALQFNSPVLAILFAMIFGALSALIYAFLTVSLKANQNVTGLTLSVFGMGVANFIGEKLSTQSSVPLIVSSELTSKLVPNGIPFLSKIPVIGEILFKHSILSYMAIICAVLLHIYLNKTRIGLNLRAIGENPAAADAMGVNVDKYKYWNIVLGGALCGLGGAYISLVTCVGNWQPNIVGGQGWIALALVIFSSWKPLRAIFGSLVFGALSVLRLYIPKSLIDIPGAFFTMLPFIVTCLVLIISSIKMKKENQQPKACGVNYFREER